MSIVKCLRFCAALKFYIVDFYESIRNCVRMLSVDGLPLLIVIQ